MAIIETDNPIVHRVYNLISDNGINAKTLAERTGVASSILSEWKKGVSKPTLESLIKIASYFNVSMDWMIFGKANSDVETLTSTQRQLLSKFDRLTPELQQSVIQQMDGMLTALSILMKNEQANAENDLAKKLSS